jgi:hypothetical protein
MKSEINISINGKTYTHDYIDKTQWGGSSISNLTEEEVDYLLQNLQHLRDCYLAVKLGLGLKEWIGKPLA